MSEGFVSGSCRFIRIHFVDKGQDFLWWDLEVYTPTYAEVIGCGPFQADVWVGEIVLSKIALRNYISFSKSPRDPVLRLSYAINKIEALIADPRMAVQR